MRPRVVVDGVVDLPVLAGGHGDSGERECAGLRVRGDQRATVRRRDGDAVRADGEREVGGGERGAECGLTDAGRAALLVVSTRCRSLTQANCPRTDHRLIIHVTWPNAKRHLNTLRPLVGASVARCIGGGRSVDLCVL